VKAVIPLLKIAVCDDSHEDVITIKKIIRSWNSLPEDSIVRTFESGDSLVSAHSSETFNFIFLNVVMPFIDGIETAKEIRSFDKKVKIVFLTSSPEFALDSYSVKASNYLLKPVDKKALFECLDELYSDFEEEFSGIAVKSFSSIYNIPFHSIEYIEAMNKRVLISLFDGKTVESTEPFYIFEEKLLPFPDFFKCHRSYIVNIHRIASFNPKDIFMRSGKSIPLSRSCRKDFEENYFETLFGKAGDIK